MTGATPYLEWLIPGQRWLAENWGEQQTWDEIRPGFLAQLGTDAGALNSPEMRLLQLVDFHAEQLGEQAREALINESEFTEVVQQQFGIWSQEQPAAGAEPEPGYAADAAPGEPAAQGEVAQAAEPTYVEGRGWMIYDAAAGEWVNSAAPAGAEAEPAVAPEPAPAEPTYVEGYGWMTYDAAAGEWVAAAAPAGAAEPAAGFNAEPGPAETAPIESAPIESATVETAPVETTSVETPPTETAQPAEPAAEGNAEPAPGPGAEPNAEPAPAENAPDGSANAASQTPDEPAPAEPLPDLAPAAAELVDAAVVEEIGPVVEEAFEGVDDLDLFSPDELQEILAAALEESGLSE